MGRDIVKVRGCTAVEVSLNGIRALMYLRVLCAEGKEGKRHCIAISKEIVNVRDLISDHEEKLSSF